MRRAISTLRARALWQQQQQATPLSGGSGAGTRGIALAAFDDERRSLPDAAAPFSAPTAPSLPPSASSSPSSSSPSSTSSFVAPRRAAHTSAPSSAVSAAAAAATFSPRFFITGARGQIGVELTRELARTHGAASIVASDLPAAVAAGRALPGGLVEGVRYVSCDVTDREGLSRGKN